LVRDARQSFRLECSIEREIILFWVERFDMKETNHLYSYAPIIVLFTSTNVNN